MKKSNKKKSPSKKLSESTPPRLDSRKESDTSQPPTNEHINPNKKWAEVNQPKEDIQEEYLVEDAEKIPGSFGGRKDRNTPVHVSSYSSTT